MNIESAPLQRAEGDSRRRSRRFKAWTLLFSLLAVCIVCTLLTVLVHRAQLRRRAVEAIRAVDGVVTYDFHFSKVPDADRPFLEILKENRGKTDHHNLKDLDPDGMAWLRRLIGPDYFNDVVNVNLTYFYDENGNHNSNSHLSDQVVRHLRNFPRLRYLDLRKTQATDASLGHLTGLKHLEVLMLREPAISDDGMQHLAGLKELRHLHISGSRITDEGLRHLTGLPRLDTLSLQKNRFTNRGLEHLSAMKSLRSLWIGLGEGRITDDGLVHLAQLPELEVLDLQKTQISDEGLAHLTGLVKLRRLLLNGCAVTADGARRLQAALPDLETDGIRLDASQ